ncbi:hypothetical protein CCAN12_640025 [Capnocytophaga canimorsus]|uniref:Uncharacterized protein n=1 Tax=Capnocytophaga canimorsus TaxID=28188 RepID=A0A0B7H8S0_9FLAO|nr:hypothetical protein CCAN12_640025 [Capnocytophaga canimorsus]
MDNLITGDIKNIEHLLPNANFEFQHYDVTKFVHVPGNFGFISFILPLLPVLLII